MTFLEALSHQEQCDEDGVMCIVSRQAVDEAIDEVTRLRQRVAELKDERSIFARTLDKRDAELTLVKADAIELREEIKRLQNLLIEAGLRTYI